MCNWCLLRGDKPERGIVFHKGSIGIQDCSENCLDPGVKATLFITWITVFGRLSKLGGEFLRKHYSVFPYPYVVYGETALTLRAHMIRPVNIVHIPILHTHVYLNGCKCLGLQLHLLRTELKFVFDESVVEL